MKKTIKKYIAKQDFSINCYGNNFFIKEGDICEQNHNTNTFRFEPQKGCIPFVTPEKISVCPHLFEEVLPGKIYRCIDCDECFFDPKELKKSDINHFCLAEHYQPIPNKNCKPKWCPKDY